MHLIAPGEIVPWSRIMYTFESPFGLHKCEGVVREVSKMKASSGLEYVRIVWDDVTMSDVHVTGTGSLYGDDGLRMSNYVDARLLDAMVEVLEEVTEP